jgi:hypothetical protein
VNGHRRAAGRRIDRNPERTECRHERRDRAFAHMGITGDHHRTVSEPRSRGEKAGGRAGIAEEQRLGRSDEAAIADDQEARLVRLLDMDAHRLQRLRHMPRVIALQRAGQMAGPISQRR